jgi:hypothetical protein
MMAMVGSSSILRQGTSYNTQDELIRIGDLNGAWGYASETWGVAIGEYASGLGNITIDQDGDLRFRLYSTTKIKLNTSGEILVGEETGSNTNIRITNTAIEMRSGTWPNIKLWSTGNADFGYVATNQGNMHWNNSNKRVEFRGGSGGTTVHAYIDTDGTIRAGSGKVTISTSGVDIDNESTDTLLSFSKGDYAALSGKIAVYGTAVAAQSRMDMFKANSTGSNDARLSLITDESGAGWIRLLFSSTGEDNLNFAFGTDLGGLATGYTIDQGFGFGIGSSPAFEIEEDAGAISAYLWGDLQFDGDLASYKNTTAYSVYGLHLLTAKRTNTAFDGDAFSTVGTSQEIERTDWDPDLPANVKAVVIRIAARDSGASVQTALSVFIGPSSTEWDWAGVWPIGDDAIVENTAIVPVDSNGSLWYRIEASGTNTTDVWLEILGYFL